MKRLLIIIFSITFQTIHSQDIQLPDIDDIFSISPKWSYITEDTNWYRLDSINNLHINGYWGRGLHNRLFDNGNFIFLEFGNGNIYTPPLTEGYILHSVDLETGIPNWVLHNNYFSGNEYVYTPFGGNMHFTQEGNIAVNGFKSMDPILELENVGFNSDIYTNVMRQVIDIDNGGILSERSHLDTARVRHNRHTALLLRETSGGKQVKYYIEYKQIDGTMRTLLYLHGVDEAGAVSEDPLMVYNYDSLIPTDMEFLSYPSVYLQISASTGVALFGRIDPIEGGQPKEVELVYFDTSNLPEITVKKEVDVLQIFPQPQHSYTFFSTIYPSENGVVLVQTAKIGTNEVDDTYTWLARYDDEGNLIRKVDRLSVEGEDINSYLQNTIVDGEFYCLLHDYNVTEEDYRAYHIVKYDDSGGQERVGGFKLKAEYSDHRIVFNSFDIMENKDVLIYLNDLYPLDWYDLKANASFLVRFDGADLGFTTGVDVVEPSAFPVSVFPNPAHDVINIKGADLAQDNWDIIDVVGHSYRNKVTSNGSEIIIHGLPSGFYFMKINENGSSLSVPFIKK